MELGSGIEAIGESWRFISISLAKYGTVWDTIYLGKYGTVWDTIYLG